MKLRIRRATAQALCAALLVSAASPAQARQQPRRPKLVVLLVVDQMRADYVDKFSQQWTGGLHRLLEHGAWFRQATYPYWSTRTCVGHATISTGSFPATHGIIGNTWWDRETGKQVACTEDSKVGSISYGAPGEAGNSAARLLARSFADELGAQSSAPVRVASFSLKSRSAIMLAGHRGAAVTWFGEKIPAWMTSTSFATAPVPFIAEYVKRHPVEADFGRVWERALPEKAYLYADEASGERPPRGWTPKFPHVLKGRGEKPDETFYVLWATSPFADAYLGGMAQAAVDALHLGSGSGTDFLAVSFSSLDLVGHQFGPFSHEVQDMLVRLDATLGALLDHLDRAVGPNNYVVALSADHGVAPIPEQMPPGEQDAGRISISEVVGRVQKALEPLLGSGQHVARLVGNDFYFAPSVSAKLLANPGAMQAAIEAILSVPGVARVFRGDELLERTATDDPLRRAASLNSFAGRSGDLIVLQKPYWLMEWAPKDMAAGVGTDHGTAYAYDTRVPVLLMGFGIRPGEYLTAVTPADIAPTLAFLCGVTLARVDGRVLTEALAIPPAAPAKTMPKR